MFDIENNSKEYREQVLRMSKKIRHRGPDWSGIHCGERAIISHERLSRYVASWRANTSS